MVNFEMGDVFLSDSERLGAKIVKFLQTAPTLWQYIWRAMRGTQHDVRYYHAGMIMSNGLMVEQQSVVKFADTHKILNRRVIVYRLSNLTQAQKTLLDVRATEDIGKGYDIPQIIGKLLTWLTGIKFFVRICGASTVEEEICVTRIGDWYDGICSFGVKTQHELTTKIIDEYCSARGNGWEMVYLNG